MKRGKKDRKPARKITPGQRARSEGRVLKSFQLGGLPIINSILERMNLESLLLQYLPADDPRTEVPTSTTLVLLIRNLLLSREPLYGIGEWASRFAPCLLGFSQAQLAQLNDDRVGRGLDRLFAAGSDFLLAVVRQVIQEFQLNLDELHNDATTVSFFGAYCEARQEGRRAGQRTLAITWGHSKDRPDLKQLLYTLTITEDGGVPLYFSCDSGNVTDDQTHRDTWDLLCQLVGGPDFLYVADSKLATSENMTHVAVRHGRFVTVLPRTRKEDKAFRERLVKGEAIGWDDLLHLTDERGELRDSYRVCREKTRSEEGFRIHWYHSQAKQERDAQWRSTNLQRAMNELSVLRNKTQSPRTRYRDRHKVQQAVDKILDARSVTSLLRVTIEEVQQETFKQSTRGRPGPDTKYRKQVLTRQTLRWEIDQERVQEAALCDGVFALISNDENLSSKEVLLAYKRQPIIEKRFSQFKSDFEVAPIYLKNIGRIQALMCAYFFVLLVQTLLERELRLAMARTKTVCLPLYPEGRACKHPTTRRVLDVFEPIQRHQFQDASGCHEFMTDLQPIHRQVLGLLNIGEKTYGD